jgi:hypothetical protein
VLLPPGQLYRLLPASTASGSSHETDANYTVAGCGALSATAAECVPTEASEREAALAQIGPPELVNCSAFQWP